MGLAFNDIDDAVQLTQNHYIKRGSFVDMQTDITQHVAVREVWKGRTVQFEGGANWEFQVQMDHNHSARTVGLFETDGSNLTDTMTNGTVEARHINAHYVYDKREKAFQRGGKAIADLVMTRYTGMMVSLFDFMEEILWGKPVDSSDSETPFGIAYWVTRSATEGFNGGNPAGFSAGRAGISTTDYPRFANWTAQYAAVSKTDLLRKMRTAHRKSRFRSPVSHAVPNLAGMKNGIYVNSDTLGVLEEVVEDQNMSLGNDLASKDGRAVFKGTPLTYVPFLDDDSEDPVYMLDWSNLAVGVLAGWENNLTSPYMVPGMHLVSRVDLDASLNMVCTDPRRQAVLSK